MSRCVSIANMQPPNLYVSKFSRITDFQTIRKRALYRSMPAIRSAKHLCPVCLKGYNTDFWLNKHIDLDHPRYRHQLELAAKKQSKSSFSARSSFPAQGGNSTIRERHSTTPSVPFNANHNAVNDPDALPSSTELSDCDQGQNLLESHASNTEVAPTTYPAAGAGAPVMYVPTLDEYNAKACIDDPFYPFGSEEEYNFAELVTLQGIPANVIDKMLKGNCGLDKGVCSSLKSNYHLRQKIDRMEDGLGHSSWKKSKLSMAWNEQHPDRIVFWHRDLIGCAKWILRQPAYKEHLVYAPVRSFNIAGHRVYDEMNTGDWWWDKQVT